MKHSKSILCLLCALMLSAFSANAKERNAENNYGIAYSDTTMNPKQNKKVVIISSSDRRGGNTDLLCDEFARGAREAGGNVEKIFLGDYNINYFTEADEQRVGDRNHEATDDAPMLIDKLVDADVIVLSSPVWYMNMTGQLKTFIDRIYNRNREITGKEYFYITACGDDSEETADKVITAFKWFVMCLPNSTERGAVKAVGVNSKGEVAGTEFMKQAYELGKKI